LIIAVAAPAAFGQGGAIPQVQSKAAYEGATLEGDNSVRLLYLTHNETPADVQMFANTVRAVTNIRRMIPYASRKTIALRGTPEQIALAEWLFVRLDKPVDPQNAKTASYEYAEPNVVTRSVRIFYFTHNETPQNLQEIVNLIRATTDIERAYVYGVRGAIVLSGTPEQAVMAEWLAGQMSQPVAKPVRRTERYTPPAPAARGDAVRVFFFAGNESEQDLQEIVNMMRVTGEMQRVYPYAPQRAIAVRGSAAQIALAELIVGQLGATANQQAVQK
jgi:hypothetical protein